MPPAGVDEEESGRRTYLRDRSWRGFSALPLKDNRKNGKRERKGKRKRKIKSEIDVEKGKEGVRNSQERKH